MSDIEKHLGTLAEEINAESRAFITGLRKTIEHGIRAGEKLAQAKALVPHGQWKAWVEANVDISMRRCQEYMQLHNHRDVVRARARYCMRW